MKLRYKNNQWEDEKGVPIAPNDQEKVKLMLWQEELIKAKIELVEGFPQLRSWQPEEGKLYDSGELVFELKYEQCQKACKHYLHPEGCSNCDKDYLKQFWVLKDKAKEIEIPTTNSIHRKEIEQFQSRIAELESKLKEVYYGPPYLGPMIAENKQLQSRIAELDSPEYVKGHADGYVDGYAQAKKELQSSNEDMAWREVAQEIYHYDHDINNKGWFYHLDRLKSKFKLVRIKESN